MPKSLHLRTSIAIFKKPPQPSSEANGSTRGVNVPSALPPGPAAVAQKSEQGPGVVSPGGVAPSAEEDGESARQQGQAKEETRQGAVVLVVIAQVASVILDPRPSCGHLHAPSEVVADLRRGREQDAPAGGAHASAQIGVL